MKPKSQSHQSRQVLTRAREGDLSTKLVSSPPHTPPLFPLYSEDPEWVRREGSLVLISHFSYITMMSLFVGTLHLGTSLAIHPHKKTQRLLLQICPFGKITSAVTHYKILYEVGSVLYRYRVISWLYNSSRFLHLSESEKTKWIIENVPLQSKVFITHSKLWCICPTGKREEAIT